MSLDKESVSKKTTSELLRYMYERRPRCRDKECSVCKEQRAVYEELLRRFEVDPR